MSDHCKILNNLNTEISKLLKSIAKEYGLHDYNIKQAGGSMKGDGYLGVITAIEMTGITEDFQNKILNLVVKSAVKGEALREKLPVSDVFLREIYMYNTVIPHFQKFLIGKYLPAFESVAKCYTASDIIHCEAIVLENLKIKGFKLWERRKPMNEEHVSLVMQQYGKFHALSFAVRDQQPEEFKNLTSSMDDIMTKFFDQSDFAEMIVKECYKILELFSSTENEKIRAKFQHFIDGLMQFIKDIPNLPDEYNVILHGDCWTNNMMFRYNNDEHSNTPTDVCFIDLQISRLGPTILDTAYYFYACSSKSIKDNFQHYLEIYYNSLSDYLTLLGSNPEKVYPKSAFLRQWKDLAKYGFILSIIVIKIMLSEQDEVTDLAAAAESDKFLAEAFSYSISNATEYNDRMIHLVTHFYENGFF